MSGDTDQLVQVVLDSGQVCQRADSYQAAQSEVKELVAKERDEPAITILCRWKKCVMSSSKSSLKRTFSMWPNLM